MSNISVCKYINDVFGIRTEDLHPAGHGISNSFDGNSLKVSVDLAEPYGTEMLLYTQLRDKESLDKMFNPSVVSSGEVLDFNV